MNAKKIKQSVNERLKDTLLEMATFLDKIGEIDVVTMREYEALKHIENKSVKRK